VWAFLGEGFLDRAYGYSSECVEHDVLALQSGPLVVQPTVKTDDRLPPFTVPISLPYPAPATNQDRR